MVELFVLAMVAIPLYLIFRFGAAVAGMLSGRRYRAYRALAQRYRGRYENRGLAEPPTVSFGYNRATVRVGLAPPVPGQPSTPKTRVVVRFAQGLPLRLELTPTARALPSQPPKGTRPVAFGDLHLDQTFNAWANDPDMVRQALRGEVRHALVTLLRLCPPAGMLLSVNPERMLVQVDRNLAVHVEPLATAVREALVIHDGLVLTVSATISQGVAVVDAGPAAPEDAGPPLCKVCGELVEAGPRMTCTRCKAPHHRDCWEFIGGCSIFGCNGKEALPG